MFKNLLIAIMLGALVSSCAVQGPEAPSRAKGKVSFSVSPMSAKSRGRLADEGSPEPSAAYVRFSLSTDAGETLTDTVEVIAHGSFYFSSPYQLSIGEYSLEEFMVLDTELQLLYMAPLEGSELAQYVPNPLPYVFSVATDDILQLQLHVMDLEDKEPSDFGYTAYNFRPVQLREVPVMARRLHDISLAEFELSLEVEARDTSSGVVWTKTYHLTNPQTVTLPIGYEQYKITAHAEGHLPQVKHFREDYFYDNLATVEYIGFELIPAETDDLIILESDGFKFYISADPCLLWGRLEVPDAYVFSLEYIKFYQIGVDEEDNYLGQLYPGGGLVNSPVLVTNFDNLFAWDKPFPNSESYCELYLDEEYRDQLELVMLEKGLLLDFDWEGTETTLEDYDLHLIHEYQ